jgi:hypothetical protein
MDGTINQSATMWRDGQVWAPLIFDDAGGMTCPICARKSRIEPLHKLPLLARFYCYRNHFLHSQKPAA